MPLRNEYVEGRRGGVADSELDDDEDDVLDEEPVKIAEPEVAAEAEAEAEVSSSTESAPVEEMQR